MNDMKKELEALLEYLIGHNRDHAEEIMELAKKALTLGIDCARNEMMEGVEKLRQSNEHLAAALDMLRSE